MIIPYFIVLLHQDISTTRKKRPTPYSYLNDSIGSRRAAFHAGHNPKMIPTAAEMPTPMPMAHAGTYAGNGEYLFVRKLANSPTPRPSNPPMAVKTTASIRN